MNKKVLYGVILLSIFLMSAATSIQPVQGYKFGVPDQAKGVEGESEVKVVDEDQWEDCFGKGHGADDIDDVFDGDSDVVGAKSKGVVKDWEKDDEIKFFWDFVLEADLDLDLFSEIAQGVPWYDRTEDPDVDSYKDAINYIDGAITDTAAYYYGIYLATQAYAGSPLDNATLWAIGNASLATYQYWAQGTLKKDEASELFSPKYEGTMVTMDTWEFYEGEYPDKPDEKDAEAPFLSEPEDLYDSYETLVDLKTYVYKQLLGPALDGNGGYQANGTSYATNVYGYYATVAGMGNMEALYTLLSLDGALGGTGASYGPGSMIYTLMGAGSQVPTAIYDSFEELIPKAGGYLYLALSGGLPVYTPTGKFLANMIEEFEDDIEDSEDTKETGHPDMDGSIPFEVSVKVDKEEMVVTMKFRMDDYIDPAYNNPKDAVGGVELDEPDEMEDWKVKFYYSEYGSQNKIEYLKGDDVFYSKESLAVIPGFEITIIIGASAIAIIGLIYVIMKKRKI
jgi:hypothetical protein